MASSFLNRTTPGVYITEIDAFGTSIVGVATAVPLFIGYTEYAGDPVTGAALYDTPVAISSMAEFASYFGGAAPFHYLVLPSTDPQPDFTANVNDAAGDPALRPFDVVRQGAMPAFNLYWQMRLFFANGGGNCYVVSAGSYWADQKPAAQPAASDWAPGAIAAADLLSALAAAGHAIGPTMTVIPEACTLDQAGYAAVAQAMLAQASALQDRMAILDLPGCLEADTIGELQDCQTNLWNAIAPQAAAASYGAAYGPALNTTIVANSDILFTSLAGATPAGNAAINAILTSAANTLYQGTVLGTVQSAIAAAFPLPAGTGVPNGPQYSGDASGYPAPATPPGFAAWQAALNNLLLNTLPIYAKIAAIVADRLDVQPPSGLLAGIWTRSDNMSGVWNAPANIALAGVSGPLFNLSDAQQGAFNVPTNGMAIDIIRTQLNRGTVVWGARTLDGNSLDYRYIQVRRTLIYIEQSIKLALQSYVFAANDATTWSTVIASVSSFLNGVWQEGGLMGSKASDAFTVSCGLGSTMTAQDVLNGYMIVAVTLQMIHPAEFIELTFTQQISA